MKLPKRLPIKLILISATVIGMGAGATLYMVQEEEPVLNNAQVSTQKPEPKPEVAPEPVVDVQEAPNVAQTNVNPPAEPNVVEEPVITLSGHLFANEMRATGIEEKDFDAVYALVLAPYGWRMIPTPENMFVWRLAFQMRNVPTLQEQLTHFKKYIEVTYGGDYNKALESARTRGSF